MYVILTTDGAIYGPFPTEERANQYAESFPIDWGWTTYPLIVPHFMGIKFTTREI